MNVKVAFLLMLICLPQLLFAGSQSEMSKAAFSAIKSGDVEAVRDLIDQGLDPNFQLGEPENVLGLAAFYERPVILADLISAGGDINHKLDEGMYFINFVANRDNFELLKLVLRGDVDLNELMFFDQYTTFTGMLRKIDAKKLKYVIENSNADVNFRPDNGYSALYHLYKRGQCGVKCIEVILDHCANPMLEIGKDGMSFKEYIKKKGDTEVLILINDISC